MSDEPTERDVEARCTCGYGGSHEPENTRCALFDPAKTLAGERSAERAVEALAEVIADAICGEKPSYSPDQACTAHRIQAERAAVALAPLLAQARREGAAAEDRAEELASINHELVAAHNALLATLAATEARAEAAERKVAAVEAQADQWEFGVPDVHIERGAVVDGLRAALRGDA